MNKVSDILPFHPCEQCKDSPGWRPEVDLNGNKCVVMCFCLKAYKARIAQVAKEHGE